MATPDGDHFVVGVQCDVTQRLELEARVREAQRMEALGKLSGGIAHDFNNVLALILGNAEIIASDSAHGSVIGDAAHDIIEAAEVGANLVERLLQYARGEEGALEEVSVNSVVTDVLALISRSSDSKIKFETDLSAAVGTIQVDRALFNTAVMNLLLNARDAVASVGTIRVSTRLRFNAGPALGTVAAIKVSDNGTGMDAVTAAKAFEPFYTTKGEGRGNGLGLPMVYNFVKQTEGEVFIDTVPGEGTAVTMLLPLKTSGAEVSDDFMRESILLVEDDRKIRKVVSLQLSRAGYRVAEVASAEEALQVLAEGQIPTVVLSDVNLGDGLSGAELFQELRMRKCPAALVFMTGFAEDLEAYPDHIRELPVLRKPFRNMDLMIAMEKAILSLGRD